MRCYMRRIINQYQNTLYCFYIILLIMFASNAIASPQALLNNSKQQLLVTVPNINDFHATLRFYQRQSVNASWHLSRVNGYQSIPVVIGKNGLAWSPNLAQKPSNMKYKQEGDDRSPAGVFTLPMAFGIENNPHPFMPYIHINKNIICVDDENSKFYNEIINKAVPKLHQDWAHAEIMSKEVPVYNTGLQVNYNPAHLPGEGSCIFVHQWRSLDSGTAGCTAMDSRNIIYIVKTLKQQDDPVLVELPTSRYSYFQKGWKLPII